MRRIRRSIGLSFVRLVREEGRSPSELAREFEPSGQSITNWVAQAENRVLRMEKEIREKQRPSSQRRATRPGEGVWVHRSGEGQLSNPDAVPAVGRDPSGLLRVASTSAVSAPDR